MTDGTRASASFARIESLRAQLENREISIEAAQANAALVGKSGQLTDDDVTTIASRAQRLLFTDQWPDSVRLSMLLRAAVGAVDPDSKPGRQSDSLGRQWIEVVSVALRAVPDARLYHDAMVVGKALLETDRVNGDEPAKGVILHALGTLNLDPWFAERSSETFRSAQADWYRREAFGETWDASRAPRSSAGLPEPAAALERAEGFYRDAAKLLEGELLSRTLNALAQTLLWESRLDKKDRDAEIRETIDQAMKALDPKANPVQLAQLFSYRSKTGPAEIPASVEAWLAKPPDELVRLIGRDDTLSFYFWTADALTSVAPSRALTLVQQVTHVFELFADETMRDSWWRVQLRAFMQATAPGAQLETDETGTLESSDSIRAIVNARLDTGKRERWNESQLAAELIRLARLTTKSDEEPFGVDLLDRAEQVAPLSLALFGDAITHLRSTLLVNSGATAFNANDFAAAADCYARALDGFFETKALSLAGPVMSRLEDVAGKGGAEGARAAVKPLMRHAMALQTLLGDEGLIGVRQICDGAISALPPSSSNDDVRATFWQIAKGLQFGTFLTSGAGQRFSRSESEDAVLAEIDALRSNADAEPKMTNVFQGALDSETILLAPYSRSSIRLEGRSARERVTNLELRYEELIDQRLRSLAGDEATQFIDPADLREGIDPPTVLLDLLEVLGNDGKRHLHYALWTREGVEFDEQPLEEATSGFLVADGVSIPRSRISDMVQSTRASVRLDSKGQDVSDEALADLEFVGKFLLGRIWPRLTALRARGKTHLCIVPNGALHFLPFHLLTMNGKPLADDWMISYLPNTHILFANRGQQTIRRHRVKGPIAMAVSFSGTKAYLPEAVPEAREVARIGKGRVVFDREATESAFLGALRKAQMVHVASHGDFPSGAAAFQRLYLSPGDGGDGSLYAHELLGLDGRGLSLVTLSACETALGRFDMGDNLRGLPANLFLAGAEAVVGTLWKVETNATSTFFRLMYKALADKSTRFEAFIFAQRETRKAHPQYCDWGAFYYAGTWV